MSLLARCLFILFFGLLPSAPSMADAEREAATAAERMERAIAFCHGNAQCEEAVHKREAAGAEKRQQREAADKALKEADPSGYYLALAGRYLSAAAFIAGAAGLYVLVMNRLFGKRRRRRDGGSDIPR
jgi:hypothetical protein